ncbi:hypothetical protein NB689_002308 [Xanthomonas sacchari]|nr:hypothetical protein [Xanthomonas sacchari]
MAIGQPQPAPVRVERQAVGRVRAVRGPLQRRGGAGIGVHGDDATALEIAGDRGLVAGAIAGHPVDGGGALGHRLGPGRPRRFLERRHVERVQRAVAGAGIGPAPIAGQHRAVGVGAVGQLPARQGRRLSGRDREQDDLAVIAGHQPGGAVCGDARGDHGVALAAQGDAHGRTEGRVALAAEQIALLGPGQQRLPTRVQRHHVAATGERIGQQFLPARDRPGTDEAGVRLLALPAAAGHGAPVPRDIDPIHALPAFEFLLQQQVAGPIPGVGAVTPLLIVADVAARGSRRDTLEDLALLDRHCVQPGRLRRIAVIVEEGAGDDDIAIV